MSKNPNLGKNIIRLTGIAAQMGVTIFLGSYFGKMLDQKYPMEKNWFTIGLTIFAVAISLYRVLKQVNKINEESDQK
ncbi:MAG: AtpZ/AtpI family protein [Flavobacteriales bacterium]|nr:AtpZ/AtpI family protein [Flavobacteriales bacterium]